MKYCDKQFEIIVQKLPVLLKTYGLFEKLTIEEYSSSILQDLYFRLFTQLTYANSNANVMNTEGKRLIEEGGERLLQLDDFEPYPNDCNDDNIATAMKKAIKVIYNNK